MEEQITYWLDKFGEYLPILFDAVKAFFLFIAGWIVAGTVSRTIKKRVYASDKLDDTIGSFLASIVRWLILGIVGIMILNLFGIQATSLVAMLGAATLAIGLALQGTLSDLAAGFMIILFRPYRNGQFVDIGGTSGTVKEITLFFTELVTPQNIQIVIPNGKAWGAIITNYSAHDTRRADITVGVDYDCDADEALAILLRLAGEDPRVLDDPEPWARVTNLGDSSVDLTLRAWAKAEDFWDMKFGMTKAIKEAFDAAGIGIPYPHQVTVIQNAEAG